MAITRLGFTGVQGGNTTFAPKEEAPVTLQSPAASRYRGGFHVSTQYRVLLLWALERLFA